MHELSICWDFKMVKWPILFSVVLFSFAKASSVPDHDALLTLIRDSVEHCYEDEEKTIKVEVTDADFESLITSNPSPPRSTKCMRYCVMKAHNLYNDDNTLNIPEMQKLFKKVYEDIMNDENLQVVSDVADECMAEITDDDRCEKAHGTAMCMISKLGESGIDIKRV